MGTLRFFAVLFTTNLKACLALRGAFWIQIVAMSLNNALFFAMWWILFRHTGEIRGWHVGDMLALYGIVATGFGVAMVTGGGFRDLARAIGEGDLDPVLTQPQSVLVNAVASKTLASGWGDIASGLLMVGLSGVLSPSTLPVLVVATLLSATTFLASGVILQSSAFWIARIENLARIALEFMVTFSLYPPVLFHGALRIVLFTLIPAGFIGFLPAGLLRSFAWSDLAFAALGTAGYAFLSVIVFHRGLRIYASGSRFGVRA